MYLCTVLELFIIAYFWQECSANEVDIDYISSCNTSAKFEYLLFDPQANGSTHCLVNYASYDMDSKLPYPPGDQVKNVTLPHPSGDFMLEHLSTERNVSVTLKCGTLVSNTVWFVPGAKGCEHSSSVAPEVEVFHEDTFLGTRESLLGIVFGLLGFLVILVASFYLLMRYRRRRRLERIRRYLGSTIIDPFENLQNIADQENGSERLIESTES